MAGWGVADSEQITNDLSSSSRYPLALPPELGMFIVAPNSTLTPSHTYPNPLVSANQPGAIHLWQGEHAGNSASSEGGGGGTTMACLDCGNQAKKDCSYRRCRTCCRSRGFDCRTHVKSTWVPSARRRERHLVVAGGGASSRSTSDPKKPRLVAAANSHISTSNTPSSRHQDSGFKPESLPGQVVAPAVFNCVRVTAMEDGEDEFAYQAVVKIGGHVFKGILYDQGPLSGDGFPNLSDLHLDAGSSGGGEDCGGGSRKNGESSPSPLLGPSNVYGGGSGGALIGGSSYGNTIN